MQTVALQKSLCESLVGGESYFRLGEAKETWEEAAWKWVSKSGQERLSGREKAERGGSWSPLKGCVQPPGLGPTWHPIIMGAE